MSADSATAGPSAENAGAPVRAENALIIAVLAAMALLPLVEIAGRRTFNVGVPGSILIVQNLTLCVTFLGAALAARADKLLALASGAMLPVSWRRPARLFTSILGVGITAWFLRASVDVVLVARDAGGVVALGVPDWIVQSVMPLGLAAVTWRLIRRAGETWRGRLVAASGLLVPLAAGLGATSDGFGGAGLLLPGIALVIVGLLLGLPLYAAIAGLALLLFWSDATPVSAVPVETLRLTNFPVLPAVPLFTLSGAILAAGRSSERLLRLFTAALGWLPGGTAIVTTFVFAFFTSFTGASGVTILSLGGLLLPVLLKSRYSEGFSIGLLTASGSIGLLLPPSLPVILYGVQSYTPIDKLFIGGIVPGTLLVVLVAAWGVRHARASGAGRTRFEIREAFAALRGAKWELGMPVVVLVGIFGGFATMVEAAALTVLYAFVVECFIHRDLSIWRDLPRVFVESGTLIGGFLIILGAALGLNLYLIYADVPTILADWTRANIESPWAFLLALNVFLLFVGAAMDIYSALFVIVPLITPLGESYGIDPVHLGIIFLANLELGYLVPPMGENLFLSAYRFDKPVMRVFRHTLPFIVILAGAVLLITYVPLMTLGLVRLISP